LKAAINRWIIRNASAFLPLRREITAILDWLAPVAESYSQSEEDRLVSQQRFEASPLTHLYVDVGANHPTRISNTYLFYRKGYHGLVVEPNVSYAPLYRRYRPRDIFFPIGCATHPQLLPFYHSADGSVLNSFSSERKSGAVRVDILPVFPLDDLLPHVGSHRILLLSIDVEGMDIEVLRSGPCLLAKTEFVVLECPVIANTADTFLIAQGFTFLHRTQHNNIYRRSKGLGGCGLL